jgi:hypothetical protein
MKASKLSKLTLVLLSIVSGQSQATTYIVEDTQAYIQDKYANIQRMIESSKELAYLKTQLDSMGTFAEMQVDNANNGFANVIARLDKGAEERQNLEQMEKSQPAKDACATFTLSAGLESSACAEVDQIAQLSADRAHRYSVATGGGVMNSGHVADVQEANAETTRAAVALMAECTALGGDKCQKPSIWFGKALTPDEYRALQLQNDIAVNIEIQAPHVTELTPGSPEHARALAQDLMRENAREQARFELEALTIETHGTLSATGERKPGKVELYEKYSSERLGSEQWMCAVTQSCGDYVPPAEIDRRSIEMKAVQTSIALDQYKSRLRTEGLMQTALFREINKSAQPK